MALPSYPACLAKRPIDPGGRAFDAELNSEGAKLGDIKKHAKRIKTDHKLALELWSSGQYYPRLLALLLFDKKQLDQDAIESLVSDMREHDGEQSEKLSEWLLANQLMKAKHLTALLASWEDHASALLRRLYWYHQARLRWTGQAPPPNTADLMASLERNMGQDEPTVQWAMNFCAGQIGVREPEFRGRAIKLGESLGLYKDEVVPRNCTPNYLPEFIRIESAKLEA